MLFVCKRESDNFFFTLFSERVRRQTALAGWRECLTFGLISLKDAYEHIGREQSRKDETNCYFTTETLPAIVSDPKAREFECVRPTLISGLLRTLASNQAAELPIKLFEVIQNINPHMRIHTYTHTCIHTYIHVCMYILE